MTAVEDKELYFLPYFIEEDIYLPELKKAEKALSTENTTHVPETITQQNAAQQERPTAKLPPLPPLLKTPVATVPVENRPVVATNTKTTKKVLILVGYQSVPLVPPNVDEALRKIFSALNIAMEEVGIINVLSPQSPTFESFEFQYLILMGGNGKNLDFMKDYTGPRNRYDVIKHKSKTIFFAESMDTYFKDVELKKKFWNKLKEVFGK